MSLEASPSPGDKVRSTRVFSFHPAIPKSLSTCMVTLVVVLPAVVVLLLLLAPTGLVLLSPPYKSSSPNASLCLRSTIATPSLLSTYLDFWTICKWVIIHSSTSSSNSRILMKFSFKTRKQPVKMGRMYVFLYS